VNEKAYTPKVISIGPFHHGDERLETMEKLIKVTYFKRFVQKAVLNVENLVSIIRDGEADVRHCYSHTSALSSDDYVKMILVDVICIIVFFFF
jgi:transposase